MLIQQASVMACQNRLNEGLKRNQPFHPPNSTAPLSIPPLSQPDPSLSIPLSPLISAPLCLPPSIYLPLSLRHGQGRISRQSQAVQTQLYDRKNSQPWERNFPSELTHTNAYILTSTQPDMPVYTHTRTHIQSLYFSIYNAFIQYWKY